MTEPYYSDDAVTIYHGDCLDLIDELTFDVVVTDPPYGIHHSTRGTNDIAVTGETATGRSSTRVLTKAHTIPRDKALELWNGPALVFGSWRAPRPCGTMLRLIWDKCVIGMGGVGPWRVSDEEIYVIGWDNPRASGGNMGTVIRYPQPRGELATVNHPTPKPVGLMRLLIDLCPPGVILDPFMGSGTTLRAAKDLGRKAIGIELDERYCEIAARRMGQEVLAL